MQRLWVCLVVCVLSPGSGVRAEDEAAVVRPADNGAALVNPGMGWVFHYYDNVPAHYGSKLAPADTLDQWPGLSVIYPLTEVQVHDLPFTAGCEPRCTLAARVRLGVDGPEIVFASTHLEHAKASLRLCQAQKLNPALAAANGLPTILAGDFNDVPDSPAIKVLQPHWTDATAGRPQPTWPSGQPRTKIDYVFFRPVDGWHVVEKQVVNEPVASDHRPLLVVLEWVPSWLTFVPEMERIADLDGRPNDSRWSAADDAKRADDLRRVQAEWKTRTPTVRSLLTPERVRSLSRWAAKQMEGYTTVPPLEKAQLHPVAANEGQGTILLESTIDTLPTHHPLVTRWLKAFVRYDTSGQKIAHVTITIRGQRLE